MVDPKKMAVKTAPIAARFTPALAANSGKSGPMAAVLMPRQRKMAQATHRIYFESDWDITTPGKKKQKTCCIVRLFAGCLMIKGLLVQNKSVYYLCFEPITLFLAKDPPYVFYRDLFKSNIKCFDGTISVLV